MTSRLQGYVGIAISLCFIFLVVKQVDVVNISQLLQQTNVFWLLIALLFYWTEILLRILRWKRILVSVDDTIRYSSVSNSFCISTAANNIFPFRVGDILRAHLLGIQRNISRFSLMGTIVLEKLIDVAAVLLLTCWGAFEVLSQLGAMSNMGFTFLIAGVGILMLGGLYLLTKNRFLSNKLVLFFHERFGHFKKGFSILLKPKNLSLVIVETLLIWTFNTLAIWAIINSLGVSLSFSEVLLLEGITGLAAAIPSAPAGIGTLQYAFLLTFGMLHLDKSVGVAASLLVQGVLLGSITVVGILIFTFDSKSRQALKRIRHE
ncbi:MAG: lysylphosphatidylglycerol synthase transmembrane domain-containing protein [Methylobacter sp.]